MRNQLTEALSGAENAVLLGHIHPDGDCIGASLGLYNYLKEHMPQISVELYLDHPADKFSYLARFDEIQTAYDPEKRFDVCITLDASDTERLEMFYPYFETAGRTFCIDHHRTNRGFAQENCIRPDASSTSEVVYTLMDENAVSRETAECLYTGIIHDTGVFKYSSATRATMEIAGKLMEKGLDCAKIIDDTFYRKTYIQNQILGRALLESFLFMDGRCIFSGLRKKDLEFYGADTNDLDGIIDQLRVTEGVECAIFIYETAIHEYKISMRSNSIVDVSKVAEYFGGGGHIRAAGCRMSGTIYDVLNNLSKHIEIQLDAHGEAGKA